MPKARQVARFTNRRRWTVEEAREAIAAQAASELSVREFAMREGLEVQRLYRWRRRLGTEEVGRPAFIEVQPRRAEPIEIVLRSGLVVRVAESIDVDVLRRIVDSLDKAGPC